MIKVIKHQDAKYKIEDKVSGDTRINLSGEIFNFLGGQKDAKINFTVYKEDYIKALCWLTTLLPLHYSPNSQSVETENYSNSDYEERLKIIEGYFGSNETASYEAQFTTASGNRYWLCGLKNGNFNIRDFLVSEKVNLKFIKKNDGTFDLRVVYLSQTTESQETDTKNICNDSSILLENVKLKSNNRTAARIIIDYLYSYDHFERINMYLIEGNENTYKFDDNNFRMNTFFYTQKNDFYYDKGDRPRAFYDYDYLVGINNEITHLTTEWYNEEENKDFVVELHTLIKIANKYYSDVFFMDDKGDNVLIYYKKGKERLPYVLEKKVDDEEIVNKMNAVQVNQDYGRRYMKSLLAKKFAILTGNSGCGKTKISKDFATVLGVSYKYPNQRANLLVVPVGADWTDNTKILGFYNPITHLFQPTEILKFILNAEKNPKIPYFLVLDEMNLSHVERYFSDFLSAVESGEPIPLYQRDDECKEKIIPETINLPENLFITGTVNIDETTYMFSPKVLDRANVIEFKPGKESVLSLFTSDSTTGHLLSLNDGTAESFMKLSRKIKASSVKDSTYSQIDFTNITDIMGKMYDQLEKAGFEFAYRTVKEISYYLIASYELDGLNFKIEEAMDEQIVQKVLPKIHGNKKQIGPLLTELEKLCVKDGEKKIRKNTEIEIEGTGAYNFGLSFEKIGEMQIKLNNTQYASFI